MCQPGYARSAAGKSQTEVADPTDGGGRMYAFLKGAQQEATIT
jgi:hypothetical protein